MSKLKLVIAEDEDTARKGLSRALNKSYEIVEASDGQEAWDLIQQERPDLVLLDINMPKIGGFQVLKKVREIENPPAVVMITAYGSERIAVDAMKAGAYDYIAKPFQLDEIRIVLSKASEKIQLKREVQELKDVISGESQLLFGTSKSMERVRNLIEKVAATNVTVLISGESGTGKELVARAIHLQSNRAKAPFVAINCAALPRDLIESELFGYKKGAFTGAIDDTKGKFETAHGGTLFLDEIGDMNLETQSKVLRVIENHRITPLGSTEVLDVDVRILTATNQDIRSAIKRGKFREDLYYRIRVVEIPLPLLRERESDILILADHFLKLFCVKHNRKGLTFTPTIAALLKSYSWPGNVRELRNVIESLVVLSTDSLDENVLREELSNNGMRRYSLQGKTFQEAKQGYLAPVEKGLIQEALEKSKGNITKAADLLGMKRQYLQQKLKQLNLDANDYNLNNSSANLS